MPIVASKREVFRREVYAEHGNPVVIEDRRAKIMGALGDLDREAPHSEFVTAKKFEKTFDVGGATVRVGVLPESGQLYVEVERGGKVRTLTFTERTSPEHVRRFLAESLGQGLEVYEPLSAVQSLINTLKAVYPDSNAFLEAVRSAGFRMIDEARTTFRLGEKGRVMLVYRTEGNSAKVKVLVEHVDPKRLEELKRKVEKLLRRSLSWQR